MLRTIAEQRQKKHSKNSKAITHALLLHLKDFVGHEVTIEELTPVVCSRFAKYLLRRVQRESARTYLQKLHAILSLCCRKGLLKRHPMAKLQDYIPRKHWHEHTFLSADELMKLSEAECHNPYTKYAFLFACYTGLRLSDIETLTWDEIHQDGSNFILIKQQQKTQREVRVPLCAPAVRILQSLPHRSKRTVFTLQSRTSIGKDLKQWVSSVGIDKHITFHVSRHTFASLLVYNGVDIFTISRLCGHTSTRTTECYTHVSDNRLQEGIRTIELLFTNQTGRINMNDTPSFILHQQEHDSLREKTTTSPLGFDT